DGHNKTFFMAAYEGVRAEGQSPSFVTVPTARMRQGDFSEITNVQIKNPANGQNFPGNIIPASLLAPTSLELLQYYPAANLPGLSSNLQGTRSVVDEADQLLLRGDQNLSNTIRLYARYNWFKTYNNPGEVIPVSGFTQPRTNHNTLVTYTHTLSPTLFNDFRI